ncbi:anthranilate synthase component I [Alysiella filiformis]|uniref:Anthranilate synthase component 1 n=1 Tax=Alysiella filiformis DSM 16848 TaxID=1120981 RepID=A0A286E1S7_9NEIS|nr:anthranilate synthase component I [Alysiella filiformis]QMT30786.1 anthranilate synthase component I [Alysiella filiformis]UBQ56232.1 anthranilate synthase component I [Alysiella filiformis DSM 16848]SOD64841.1 anthranilate synthase component 1 [Alysiella filiformis DSM 16848]
MISKKEYLELAHAGYNRIPLVQEVLADLDTPLSIYLKLANQPFSYLLESVVGGERFGRYSFIGLPCHTYLKVSGEATEVYQNHQLTQTHTGNPLPFIEQFHAQFNTPEIPKLPRFTGGLVGYFGYETIYYFEHIKHRLKNPPKNNPLNTPDILLMLSQELAVIDNLSGKIYLIVYADPANPQGYELAQEKLANLRDKLRQSVEIPLSLGSETTQPEHSTGETAFKSYVRQIREYILNGDCMQVVPAQGMKLPFKDNPLHLYRALRTLNPSPYLFYYDFGDFHIVGSSPEILVRRERDKVVVRPIAGTRLRGATPEQDAENARDLLNDPKEIAEHTMLIDLGRNDVGRISEIGSVVVTDKMVIEKYSHVMHIVSNVEGSLKQGVSNMDILAATFPAGTLSGAPKVRALEIIEELETEKRNIFGGAVGVWGFNQDMDLAIAIRTAIIQDDVLYVKSGAGIVADSVEESEWQETQNKARAVLRAAQMVQEGLDS